MNTRPPESEPLLTPAEVAAMFRVDPKTVTRWAKAGKLSSIRTLGWTPPLPRVRGTRAADRDGSRAAARRRGLTSQVGPVDAAPHDFGRSVGASPGRRGERARPGDAPPHRQVRGASRRPAQRSAAHVLPTAAVPPWSRCSQVTPTAMSSAPARADQHPAGHRVPEVRRRQPQHQQARRRSHRPAPGAVQRSRAPREHEGQAGQPEQQDAQARRLGERPQQARQQRQGQARRDSATSGRGVRAAAQLPQARPRAARRARQGVGLGLADAQVLQAAPSSPPRAAPPPASRAAAGPRAAAHAGDRDPGHGEVDRPPRSPVVRRAASSTPSRRQRDRRRRPHRPRARCVPRPGPAPTHQRRGAYGAQSASADEHEQPDQRATHGWAASSSRPTVQAEPGHAAAKHGAGHRRDTPSSGYEVHRPRSRPGQPRGRPRVSHAA